MRSSRRRWVVLLLGLGLVIPSAILHAGDDVDAPPMQLVGHSHTALSVSDMDRTLGWYQRVLGMEVLFDAQIEGAGISAVTGEPGTRMRIAKGRIQDTVLELIQLQHRRASKKPELSGVLGMMGSITFYVPDIPEAHRQAAALGAHPSPMVDIDGTVVFFIEDPDGTAIEFNQARK